MKYVFLLFVLLAGCDNTISYKPTIKSDVDAGINQNNTDDDFDIIWHVIME